MAIHRAGFLIVQATTTIDFHLLKHRDNAAVELYFVSHAVVDKIYLLKAFILAVGEFFKADHTITIDVELFAMDLPHLWDASPIWAFANPVRIITDTGRPAPIRKGK